MPSAIVTLMCVSAPFAIMSRAESQAIAGYTLATDLDPKFTLAYARLGAIYLTRGNTPAAASTIRRPSTFANELRTVNGWTL